MRCSPAPRRRSVHVVLLAEDVDRNVSIDYGTHNPCSVVLLAEDVDRNLLSVFHHRYSKSRPPRGGRG